MSFLTWSIGKKAEVPLAYYGHQGNGVLELHQVLGTACERQGPILSFRCL